MAEVAIESAPQKVRDLFNRGFGSLERGNIQYAVELLSACLDLEPAALRARKFLLAALIQQRRASPLSPLGDALTLAKYLTTYLAAVVAIRGKKPARALAAAEKLLRVDPLHPRFILLFADAAELAGLPEAAALTLETAREHRAGNLAILRRLADLHMVAGNTEAARDCFEQLAELCPNDPEVIKAYKNSMALHSINRDGWQQAATGGSFRDVIKNKDEATRLEQESKAVKSGSDADDLIADMLAKLQAEPDNMNYFRGLARLYLQKLQFEDAIATLEEALQRSPGDPELDQMLSSVRLQQLDHEIATLRANGDEDAAHNREVERAQFVLGDLEDRVRRYPNDLRVRYEFGVALFGAERLNEAIQQFQAAQRSPKHRIRALYHLALCFKQKGQYDMAAQQLTTAAADLAVMDSNKKDILYELATLCELSGDTAQALKYYKEIYQVDIGYRDVAAKVEQVYGG